MDTSIIEKETKERTIALKEEAGALEVTDQESYAIANEKSAETARALKVIDEKLDPLISSAHTTHKGLCDLKKQLREPIEAIKKDIESKMITWYRAEQARAAEERRKAEEEARKKAEEEALKNAQALQDAGMTEAAESVLEQPVVIQKITVSEPMKGGGESYRETWGAECVDLMALVKAVASGLQPLAYLEPNMMALNGAARMFKGTVQIPGIKITSSTTLARRLA